MILRLLLLLTVIGHLCALLTADLTSSWTGMMEANGNQTRIVVTLIQKGGNLSGWFVRGPAANPVAIENCQTQGDVKFDVHPDGESPATVQLSLDGTKLNGEYTAGNDTSKLSLMRAVYRVGGGVSAPTLIRKTEPEYPDAERAAKRQGTVT